MSIDRMVGDILMQRWFYMDDNRRYMHSEMPTEPVKILGE